MIYAVIDTNVLVAAAKSHKPDSSTSRVLSLVFSGVIQPLVCDEILDEYESVLKLPVLAIPEGRHLKKPIRTQPTRSFMKSRYRLKTPIW